MGAQHQQQRMNPDHEEGESFRSTIIKDQDLKEFDKFNQKPGDIDDDDDWAEAQAEVDFR